MKQSIENVEVGERLKELRKKHNVTQKEVAEFLDISQTQVSLLEKGKRRLKLSQLVKLSELWAVPEEYFLYGETDEMEDIPHFKSTQGMELKTLWKMNRIIRDLHLLRKIEQELENEI